MNFYTDNQLIHVRKSSFIIHTFTMYKELLNRVDIHIQIPHLNSYQIIFKKYFHGQIGQDTLLIASVYFQKKCNTP